VTVAAGFPNGASLLERVRAALIDCDCPVCAGHGDVHAQVPRVILGQTVHVDVELAPLLDELAAAGVLTVASCIDLAEAVSRLWPAHLPTLLAARDRPGVHYGHVIAHRLAFVRLVNGDQAAPFLAAVERSGGIVTRGRLIAQAAFDRRLLGADIRRLIAAGADS
jgi:hypothetical protein